MGINWTALVELEGNIRKLALTVGEQKTLTTEEKGDINARIGRAADELGPVFALFRAAEHRYAEKRKTAK